MKRKRDKVDKAIKTIRGYCGKVKRCERCRFRCSDGDCLFMKEFPPCDWSMDKINQRTDTEAGA